MTFDEWFTDAYGRACSEGQKGLREMLRKCWDDAIWEAREAIYAQVEPIQPPAHAIERRAKHTTQMAIYNAVAALDSRPAQISSTEKP